MSHKLKMWSVAFYLALPLLAIWGCIPSKPQPPKPEPPEAAVSIVILYDSAAADDLANYADPALSDYAAAHGHQLRIHPADVTDETAKTPAYLAPYVAAAKGKAMPVAMVGRGGKVSGTLEKATDVQAIIRLAERKVGAGDIDDESLWAGGSFRKLGGLKPAKPGAASRWPVEGSAKDEPLIAEKDWRDVDFGPAWRIHDQDGYNSCCPTSGALIVEEATRRAGLKKAALSAVDAYYRINGGHDQGATLDEFLTIAVNEGVCDTTFCADQGWKSPTHKDGFLINRKKHRVLRATWCPDWEAIASAVQRRKPVQFGILVDSRFNPDAKGIIGPKRGRSGGGHAVTALGMRKVGGEWYIDMQNSWGSNWGGSADGAVPKGCCLLHHSWIEPAFGAWACAGVVSPSDDPIAFQHPSLPAAVEPTHALLLPTAITGLIPRPVSADLGRSAPRRSQAGLWAWGCAL